MHIDNILQERGERYGRFEDNAATSQALKKVMKKSPNWEKLSDAQKEGLEMIQHKIARMLHGDHLYLDSVLDIVGYSTLIKEAMEKNCEQKTQMD